MVLKLALCIIYCGVLLYWQLALDIFKLLVSGEKLPRGWREPNSRKHSNKTYFLRCLTSDN